LHIRLRRWSAALVALFALAPVALADEPLTPADLILDHGKIVTMAGDSPTTEAVAVRAGRILATGASAEIRKYAGTSTQIIDLRGRTLLPGFYDNHIHLGGRAGDPRQQDWSAINSKAALLAALAKRAAALPKGEWILGDLTNENMPQERLPTRWEMDTVTPDHPVVLERGHITLGNSLTMKLSGVTDATPAPIGGDIDRNAKGQAIGWFREGAGKRLIKKAVPPAPPVPDEIAEQELKSQLQALLPLGITSINVAGMRPEVLRSIQRAYARWGEDLPRATVQLRLSPGHDSYDNPADGVAASIAELKNLSFITGFGSDRLRLGAVKMSIDGGFSAAAFYTLEPYPHQRDFHGVVRIDEDTLYAVSKRAHDLGWQLGIHAIGDAAVKMVVDVYARIQEESPRADARHFIHHLSVLPPEETLAKMEKYKIYAASQPNFTYSLGPYNAAPALSAARLATNNPQMSLIKHNIAVSYGSDGMPTDPRVGIYAATTRKGIDGKVYGQGERVPMADAVRMYTLEPAVLNFVEKDRGSIEAGKVADFVVLGKDIMTAAPRDIRSIPIDMTIVGGKLLHTRAILSTSK
jgi:predicted amidohydrolase YtcJ